MRASPAGAGREELERRVVHLRRARRCRARRPSARRSSASTCSVLERVQLVHAAAREQRRVDLEVGVLGRGAHQHHEPLLDGRQQRVLLRLVEAVDLVEEEDRALAARGAPVLGARSSTSRTSARPAFTADASSNAARAFTASSRASVVLPVPGGPYRIIECGRPSSIAVRSAEPRPSRCSCPTNSPSDAGRIRAASGRSGAGTAGLPAGLSPRGRRAAPWADSGSARKPVSRLRCSARARPPRRSARCPRPRPARCRRARARSGGRRPPARTRRPRPRAAAPVRRARRAGL